MPTQTKTMEAGKAIEEVAVATKRNGNAGSEIDARKALHDLFFETGALPSQQPKPKPKEPESKKSDEQAARGASSASALPDSTGNGPGAATSLPWKKAVAFVSASLILAFGAYRAMPKLGVSTAKAEPHHTHSPLIQQAINRENAPNSPVQAEINSPAPGTLTLTPSFIMAQYLPGQNMTQTLKVDNQTGNAMTFEMEAEDLVAQGDELVSVPAGDSANSVAATAVFSQKYVRVGPMESGSVQVTLSWPAATTVRGVLARFRATGDIHLGGSAAMMASLGTLITFTRGQASETQDAKASAGSSASSTHFTVSQWSRDSGNNPASARGQESPAKSSTINGANYAGLEGKQ